ncbi:MAG: LacI family transcriptional regulator [Frankiales bacterium]|nr:LacI family transcriptional regulator [Frankiales bacterium]
MADIDRPVADRDGSLTDRPSPQRPSAKGELPTAAPRARRGLPGGTLAAVAASVGVSRTTASNAYNRPDQLSAELRERILAAAEQLGYAGPDPVARSLRTRQAEAVGLLVGERLGYAFSDPGAVEFMHGLGEACSERGRSLLMIPTPPGSEKSDTVLRAAVDGFIVTASDAADRHLRAVLSRPQPAVVVDGPLGLSGVDFVGIDDRAAFEKVAAHVIGLGHRRIGVVSVRRGEDVEAQRRPRPLGERIALGQGQHPVRFERLMGLLAAAAKLGVSAEEFLVTERPYNSREEGTLAARELLAGHPELTAIMATTDILALGALDELNSRGIGVPQQLTVSGFDDVPAAAAAGLTTVRQPLEEKGRAAIATLLDGRPRSRAKRVILPTALVVRASSGPVRSGKLLSN